MGNTQITFYNGEVSISALKIGVVVQNIDSRKYGHIVGFSEICGGLSLRVKFQRVDYHVNVYPKDLCIFL